MCSAASPPPKVLLVDDLETVLAMYGAFLEKKGYQIQRARSGKSALECIKAENFDAVIIDHYMPDLSGLQVVQAVNRHYAYSEKSPSPERPAILLFTAYANAEVRSMASKLGIAEVLGKPVHPVELEKLLSRALQAKGELGAEDDEVPSTSSV